MDAHPEGNVRRWAAAAAGAVVAMTVLFLFLRVPHSPPLVALPPAPIEPKARLELSNPAAGNVLLGEQTAMHDQTPLFLPTERNVRIAPPQRPEAGRSVLEADVLKPTFGDTLALGWPEPVQVPEKPADAIFATEMPAPLYGFGRVEEAVPAAPPRGATVEVVMAATNRRLLTAALPPEARPALAGEKMWRPVEFLAAVDAKGLVGSLVVSEHSDAEEVESYFRNYLARAFRLGERLPPGYYRVIVGP
jgi:hypothetical protein